MQQFIRISNHILNTDVIGSVQENYQRDQHEGGGTCTRIWLRWGNSLPLGTLSQQPPPYLDVTGREAQTITRFFSGLEQSGQLANPLRPAAAQTDTAHAEPGNPAMNRHTTNRGGRPPGSTTRKVSAATRAKLAAAGRKGAKARRKQGAAAAAA